MTITLEVTERDKKTTLGSLRSKGNVPAVVYGPKQESIAISVDSKSLDKVRREAGESTIVELSGLKKPIEVLIKNVDFNPIKQQVLHVDFYAVEMDKEITTNIKLEFVGEAPVEDSKAGNINKVLHEVEVTCKPADLPNHIDVDLTSLVNIEDKIHVSDLKVPKGVTINNHAEDPVVVVSPSRLQTEDEEEASNTIDMDAIEVEKKGKTEESQEEK